VIELPKVSTFLRSITGKMEEKEKNRKSNKIKRKRCEKRKKCKLQSTRVCHGFSVFRGFSRVSILTTFKSSIVF